MMWMVFNTMFEVLGVVDMLRSSWWGGRWYSHVTLTQFISPGAFPPELFLNFTIHHDNSVVSLYFKPCWLHTESHRPSIGLLHTSGSLDKILEGGRLLHPITLTWHCWQILANSEPCHTSLVTPALSPLLRVSALHYSAGCQVSEGFWTVASARALYQPTIAGLSISRIVVQ